jgi:hypothetical protein
MSSAHDPVRWWSPKGPVLRGERFSRDTPPFDPFPDVTQVTKGYCPVAISHDLLWGRTYLGRRDSWIEGQQLGEQYHRLISTFRTDVATGRLRTNHLRDRQIADGLAQGHFDDYAERHKVAQADADVLRDVFRRYVTRKWADGELHQLPGEHLLTEVDVANPRCQFQFGETQRHYPLRGRVDELNLSRRLLIERTLEKDPLNPDEPPRYKFWQAWLYAQLILTLEDFRRPSSLGSLWEGPLDVVVETPDRDYEVVADERFSEIVSSAYYWIQRISGGASQTAAYNEAACSPENRDDSCTHCNVDCFTTPIRYPADRDTLRRLCGRYARAFLNERIWDYDLWFYRQCLLPPLILENEGDRVTARIVELQSNHLRVEVARASAAALQGRHELRGIPAVMGNFFVGVQLRLFPTHGLVHAQNDRVVLEFTVSTADSRKLRDAGDIELLVPPDNGISISSQPPGFLKDIDRHRLGRLLKIGAKSPTTAQKSGVIRALQTITGELKLVR